MLTPTQGKAPLISESLDQLSKQTVGDSYFPFSPISRPHCYYCYIKIIRFVVGTANVSFLAYKVHGLSNSDICSSLLHTLLVFHFSYVLLPFIIFIITSLKNTVFFTHLASFLLAVILWKISSELRRCVYEDFVIDHSTWSPSPYSHGIVIKLLFIIMAIIYWIIIMSFAVHTFSTSSPMYCTYIHVCGGMCCDNDNSTYVYCTSASTVTFLWIY